MIDVSHLGMHLTVNKWLQMPDKFTSTKENLFTTHTEPRVYFKVSEIIVLDVPGHIICDFPGVPAHQMFQL